MLGECAADRAVAGDDPEFGLPGARREVGEGDPLAIGRPAGYLEVPGVGIDADAADDLAIAEEFVRAVGAGDEAGTIGCGIGEGAGEGVEGAALDLAPGFGVDDDEGFGVAGGIDVGDAGGIDDGEQAQGAGEAGDLAACFTGGTGEDEAIVAVGVEDFARDRWVGGGDEGWGRGVFDADAKEDDDCDDDGGDAGDDGAGEPAVTGGEPHGVDFRREGASRARRRTAPMRRAPLMMRATGAPSWSEKFWKMPRTRAPKRSATPARM